MTESWKDYFLTDTFIYKNGRALYTSVTRNSIFHFYENIKLKISQYEKSNVIINRQRMASGIGGIKLLNPALTLIYHQELPGGWCIQKYFTV